MVQSQNEEHFCHCASFSATLAVQNKIRTLIPAIWAKTFFFSFIIKTSNLNSNTIAIIIMPTFKIRINLAISVKVCVRDLSSFRNFSNITQKKIMFQLHSCVALSNKSLLIKTLRTIWTFLNNVCLSNKFVRDVNIGDTHARFFSTLMQ